MYIFWNWFFVRDVRNQNQGHVSRNCIPKKLFEQIGTGVFIFTFFNYNAWNWYSCRSVFGTLSNIYDRDFLRKKLTAFGF